MFNLKDPVENRRYYKTICSGSCDPLLDRSNYEWPRIEWLIEGSGWGASVLDIGCGTGDFTQLLKERMHRPVGLDPSEKMIEEARRRYPETPFIRGFAEDAAAHLQFWEGLLSFDVVTCGDVIEHVIDPHKFIDALRSMCKQYVLVTTPLGVWQNSTEHIHVWTLDTATEFVRGHGGQLEVLKDSNGTLRWLGMKFPGEL